MISVVIPTYKRPDLLDRLLTSISMQTLKPSEVIVVDDASKMNEEYSSCIDKFSKYIPNLIYISLDKNSGAPHARNVGINNTSCDWIALVDDDDEWYPEKLKKQWVLACKAEPDIGLIYTWAVAESSNNQVSYINRHLIRGDARRAILSTNFIVSASVVVRKIAILEAGLFDEELPSCQDWDMWVRIFLKGYKCDVVPEILTLYHRHGRESIGLSHRAVEGYKLFLDRHFGNIFRYTSFVNIAKKIWLYYKVWNF